MREMYKSAGIMPEVYDFCESIEKSLEERFKAIDAVAEYNQLKVVMAMQANKVSEAHFQPSSGYGYDDLGRDTLEKVYAHIFHTEDALVRPHITCGTHALTIAQMCIRDSHSTVLHERCNRP